MKILAGYTGFVGSNILAQQKFDLLLNSKNLSDLSGKNPSLLIWAGVKAEKWRANLEPEADRAHIDEIVNALSSVKSDRAVLISTVDVYPDPSGVDEESMIPSDNPQAYGRNRRYLEEFFVKQFPCSHIIRLPGLFGDGLKKNVIHDFLNGKDTSTVHSEARFQFYSLDWIGHDIDRVLKNDIRILNVATEPVSVREVALVTLGTDFTNHPPASKIPAYDFRSKHSAIWGHRDGYLYTKSEVLNALGNYARRSKV